MSKSIDAYDDEARVARYDADMDLMHPNRHKMVDVALEVLRCTVGESLHVLDLGVGTGYFASRLLRQFPGGTVVGLDGSAAMIDLASSRLRGFIDERRVRLVQASFQEVDSALPREETFDAVFSSYALHHLSGVEKRRVIAQVIARLAPGGWFINADLVSHPSAEIARAMQEVRVAGIHYRNRGKDPRFATPEVIHTFLDNLEATEGDQPLTMEADLALLRECGISNAAVLWKEFREIVYGGSCTTRES